jgi:hypothetical protein
MRRKLRKSQPDDLAHNERNIKIMIHALEHEATVVSANLLYGFERFNLQILISLPGT